MPVRLGEFENVNIFNPLCWMDPGGVSDPDAGASRAHYLLRTSVPGILGREIHQSGGFQPIVTRGLVPARPGSGAALWAGGMPVSDPRSSA